MLFVNIVLPIFFTALIGFVYARIAKPPVKPINALTLYVLIPALVFTSLLETEVSGPEVGQIASFAVLLTAAIIVLMTAVNRFLQLDREHKNALFLTTAFMNAGNYGFPVILYAVGEAGFARAVIFVIVETFLVYSLGVYFAAAGQLDTRRALLAVIKLPTLHAAVLALIIRTVGLTIPPGILDTLSSLGDAGIVVMLVALGMQLAHLDVSLKLTQLGVASVTRLVISPLLGVALVKLLNMAPVTAKAMILEAAMPTAVITSILAAEFGSAPELVSSTVLVSTTLSFASITVILTLLL